MKHTIHLVITSDDHYNPEASMQTTTRRDLASSLAILDNCQADPSYNFGQAWTFELDTDERSVISEMVREFKKPLKKQVELNKRAKVSAGVVKKNRYTINPFAAPPQYNAQEWAPVPNEPAPGGMHAALEAALQQVQQMNIAADQVAIVDDIINDAPEF